jgi:hypothetical protein
MKEAFKQMVTNMEWYMYVRTLQDTHEKQLQTQAWEVKRLILAHDQEFWQNYANYCSFMMAAMVALKEFNGKKPCMTNINIIMRILWHHLTSLYNIPSNMPSHLVDPIEDALLKR